MGWIVAACNSKSQKRLTIDISTTNLEGQRVVDAFIKYIREKDNTIITSIIANNNMLNNICIKYDAHNQGRIIYNGYDLNEALFDSLYRQIIIIND